MTLRRAVLSVPGSNPSMIAKASRSAADEIVVDLEDAVAPNQKDSARENIAGIEPRASGAIAVRVNAVDTPWFEQDLVAAFANHAVRSIVVPKADDAGVIARVDQLIDEASRASERPVPLGVQALIESARGLVHVNAIAAASERIVSLILGYADLAASLGRRPLAPWQFAQDAVVVAARAAGVQAIDGPLLSVDADDTLVQAATHAEALGFDGKWVIHPRQIDVTCKAFVPAEGEVTEARELLAAMDAAVADGRGAVEWRGRMLDEAVAAQARRIVDRAAPEA